MVEIKANFATAKVKHFLKEFCNADDKEKALHDLIIKLRGILEKNPKDEVLLHAQLFIHISDPQIISLRTSKTEFDPIILPDKTQLITPADYVELVNSLQLHLHFLKLLISIKHLPICKELIQLALTSARFSALDSELASLYLLTLGKITHFKGDFSEGLVLGLDLLMKSEGIPDFEKLVIILKTAGLTYLEESDLEKETEFTAFADDWNYDISKKYNLEGDELFNQLLSPVQNESAPEDSTEVLKILNRSLEGNKGLVLSSLKEIQATRNTLYKGFADSLEYIGAAAHLTQILLIEISPSFEKLFHVLTKFSKFKPKTSTKELNFESLEEFCKYMKEKGDNSWSNKEWFLRLLEFDNCLQEQVGFITCRDFIKAHPLDLEGLRALMGKIELTPIDERINTLVVDAFLGLKREEDKSSWISEFFGNGLRSRYILSSFAEDLNMICARAGSLENGELDREMNDIMKQRILGLCYQNPLVALEKFVIHALQCEHFALLHECSLFFQLKDPESEDLILSIVLASILKSAEPNTPLMERLISSLHFLVAEKFLDFSSMYGILSKQIESSLSGLVNYPKALSLICILEKLILFGSQEPEERLHEMTLYIAPFITRIKAQTCIFAKGRAFNTVLKIRDKCINLNKVLQVSEDDGIKAEDLQGVDPGSFIQFYVRSHPSRPIIKAILTNPKFKYPLDYNKILPRAMNWLLNLSSEEWDDGIAYLQLLFATREDFRISFINFGAFLRELVLFSQIGLNSSPSDYFAHILLIFGHYMKGLMKSKEFKGDFPEQSAFVLTLVSLSDHYDKGQDEPGDQQILMMLYDLVEWIMKENTGLQKEEKDELGDIIEMLPEKNKRTPFKYAILKCIGKEGGGSNAGRNKLTRKKKRSTKP